MKETIMSIPNNIYRIALCLAALSACSSPTETIEGFSAPSLGGGFGACVEDILALPDRAPTVCFYAQGANFPVESSAVEACNDNGCDLKTWNLRESADTLRPLEGPAHLIPFADAANAQERFPGRVVMFSDGPCPASPPYDPYAQTECTGSSSASGRACFAMIAVELQLGAEGIVVPPSAASTLIYSRRFRAEVEQEGLEFDGMCDAFNGRIGTGDAPSRRTVRLEITGSGAGAVAAENLAGFGDCIKTEGAAITCEAEAVLVGSSIRFAAQPELQSTVAWGGPCADAEDVCSVEVDSGPDAIVVPVRFDLKRYTLTIDIASQDGDGAPHHVPGAIRGDIADADGAEILCELPVGDSLASCAFELEFGTVVQLSANSGSNFALAKTVEAWGGDCPDAFAPTCALQVEASRVASATFEFGVYPLTLLPSHGVRVGGGRVFDDDGLIDCGSESIANPERCTRVVQAEERVRLHADGVDDDKKLLSWNVSGAQIVDGCLNRVSIDGETSASCELEVGAEPVEVKPIYGYRTSVSVRGDGTVASTPGFVDCAAGETCTDFFEHGGALTLAANPVAQTGARFLRWTHDTNAMGTERSLARTATDALDVTAVFGHQLDVTIEGAPVCGSVTATSDELLDGTFSCPSGCSGAFAHGAQITLVPQGNADGSSFTGWSGDCAGGGDCVATMDGSRSIGASFSYPLSVEVAAPAGEPSAAPGTGGRVTGTNIDCPSSSCETSFLCEQPSTRVRLTALPAVDYGVGTWTGCTLVNPANTCFVDMNEARTFNQRVTHTFECQRTLTIGVNGGGSVTQCPGGGGCVITDLCNATVLVSATPSNATTPQIPHWSPGCPLGAPSCSVALAGQHRTLDVTFTYPLSVTPPANGTIRATTAGVDGTIDCGASCSAHYQDGLPVTLDAIADPGYRFTGWSGCTEAGGTATATRCVLPMNAPVQGLTASFERVHTLALTMAGAPASIALSGGLASCTTTTNETTVCTYIVAEGTSVTLTPTPSLRSVMNPWAGNSGCTGSSACTVTMNRDVTITASFLWELSVRFDLTAVSNASLLNGACVRSLTPTCAIHSCFGGTGPTAQRTCHVLPGTEVTLEGTPPPGSPTVSFDHYRVIETGQRITDASNPFEIDRATIVEATFSEAWSLDLDLTGRGEITGNGVTCSDLDPTCVIRVARTPGTVDLVATPNPSGLGWTTAWPPGLCVAGTGIGNTCRVQLTANRSATVPFEYPVSFGQDVVAGIIQTAGCTNCHAGGSSAASESDLVFAGRTPRQIYDQVVGENCNTASACATLTSWVRGCSGHFVGPSRINPASPVNSLFLQMPASHPTPATDLCPNHGSTVFASGSAHYNTILDWISGGAPFN
ncbi:MAG: hypothetical protein RMA76_18605 [Deltaproteobacteria bacterium]